MVVKKTASVDQVPVTMEGSSGCHVRWLLGEADGAPNFAMREFTLAPGGFTPRHHHPYEHEVYVVEGQGTVLDQGQEVAIAAGDVILVKPDEVHQFRNAGNQALRFLCLIPNSVAHLPVTMAPECGVMS